MPTWAPGSSGPIRAGREGTCTPRPRGFTLIELMIVVAIVGLASSLVVLAIRDPAATRLEQEAVRLGALLESARAEARASGLAVHWRPGRGLDAAADGPDFRFIGLPRALELPQRWLDPATTAEIPGASSISLGPEPMIGAHRIVLRLADRRLDVVTDGLGPFTVVGADAALESGL